MDDFASIEEVLERHCRTLVAQDERPADLVVIDGGTGQLGRARQVLDRHGFADAELIGLAKREETIVRENGELRLPRTSEALKLLQRVRDEAHRFAITYHRLLRDQRTTASELDLIPGIGQVKKLALLHHFGSVAKHPPGHRRATRRGARPEPPRRRERDVVLPGATADEEAPP